MRCHHFDSAVECDAICDANEVIRHKVSYSSPLCGELVAVGPNAI